MKKEVKKRLVILGSIVLLISLPLSGCTNSQIDGDVDKALFVGTWNDIYGNYMTFTSDGYYNSDLWIFGGSGNWDINNGKIIFTHSGIGGTTSTNYPFSFSDNNNRLDIQTSSGYKYQFTRQ